MGKESHRAQQGKSRQRRREKVQEGRHGVWAQDGAQERGRMLPQAFKLGLVPQDGWRGLLAGLAWIIQWLRLTNKGKSLHGKAGLPLGNSPNICSAQSFPFLKMPKKAGRGGRETQTFIISVTILDWNAIYKFCSNFWFPHPFSLSDRNFGLCCCQKSSSSVLISVFQPPPSLFHPLCCNLLL